MKTPRTMCIVCALIISAAVCSSAYPSQAIGTITSVEGVADLYRSGEKAAFLKENDDVMLNDRIRTKSYSKAEITLADKSVVRLAPNTCITISEFILDDKNRRKNAVINLSRGEVEAVVSKTGKPETFHIQTPNAEATVKGSDIFVFYQGGKTGALVKEGLMSLSNPITPDKRIGLGKGDFSLVSFKEPPIDSRPYLDADLARHNKEVSPAMAKKWVSYKGVSTMTASVVIASGVVRVYKADASDWRAAKKGELLTEDDKLQTGTDGLAEIKLGNGNTLLLNPDTELIFRKMEYDPKTGEYNNTFESNRGKIKAVIEKLGKSSTFQIKTPTALCGARGTLMFLDISTAATQAFYEGGGGYVTSTISGNTQNVEPGQNCASDAQGAITNPVYTSTEQQLSMDQSFGAQDMASDLSDMAQTTGNNEQITPSSIPSDLDLDSLAVTNLATTNLVPFEQTVPQGITSSPAAPTLLWEGQLTMNMQTGFYAGFTSNIKTYSDNTWTATYSGTINTGIYTNDWFVQFDPLANTYMRIDSSSDISRPGSGPWETNQAITGTFNNRWDSQNHPISSGSASGTFSTNGSISGTGSGTWS